ncbi:MAG: hypothetical protein MZW92_22965 [Comamonadaceae bacterium]|nr:hypothetical protein [Comamonadaceae bacterium]
MAGRGRDVRDGAGAGRHTGIGDGARGPRRDVRLRRRGAALERHQRRPAATGSDRLSHRREIPVRRHDRARHDADVRLAEPGAGAAVVRRRPLLRQRRTRSGSTSGSRVPSSTGARRSRRSRPTPTAASCAGRSAARTTRSSRRARATAGGTASPARTACTVGGGTARAVPTSVPGAPPRGASRSFRCRSRCRRRCRRCRNPRPGRCGPRGWRCWRRGLGVSRGRAPQPDPPAPEAPAPAARACGPNA